MYSFLYILLLLLLGTRANSTYHPHLLFKRHVIIKNKIVSKLLIDQSDPVNSRAKNAKANRNKLTYCGIIFYGLFLVLCCFSFIMTLLPEFPCESFVYESRLIFLYGNTLNEKLPISFAFTLLFAEVAFHLINTRKYAVEKSPAKKFICVMHYLFAILSSIAVIGTLWLTISTIIEAI
jgi:hypothetical protein